jgi:hypothetical protein
LTRRKNIKAGFLLFSWFLIFAHGILPHNHISENLSAPGFTQQQDCQQDGELSWLRQLSTEPETCNISNILFQKFNADDCFEISVNREYIDPFLNGQKLYSPTSVLFPGGPSASIVLLRAPPVA